MNVSTTTSIEQECSFKGSDRCNDNEREARLLTITLMAYDNDFLMNPYYTHNLVGEYTNTKSDTLGISIDVCTIIL